MPRSAVKPDTPQQIWLSGHDRRWRHANTRSFRPLRTHVTRVPPQRSPDDGKTPAHARQNGAVKREWSRQLPGTPRPRQRGQRPQRPNDALRASPRHDHPDAPVRRRGHPRPLEHASAVPTDPRPPRLGERSTTRAQTRIRLPPAAPKVKSRAQSRIPVESHLRSSTEPHKS